MKISWEIFYQLIENKFCQVGLKCEYVVIVVEVLVYVDVRGIYFYGVVRVEYYVECILKGGINCELEFCFEEIGLCLVILYVDNVVGQVVVKMGMEYVIKIVQ